MSHLLSILEEFFVSYLRSVHEGMEGLNCQYEPNRVDQARIHTGFHRFTDIGQTFHNNNNSNNKDMYVFLIKANCRLFD